MKKIIRILVVGGSGYIGSAVFDYLSNYGLDVYKTTRDLENILEKKIHLDLLDKEEIKTVIIKYKFDIIINASGYIYYSKEGQKEMLEELMKSNVYTISNLMEVIGEIDSTKPKFIHLSSMTVFGNAEYTPVDERHSTKPTSIYGISKLTAEHVIRYLSYKNGVKALILRLPGVFGGSRKCGAIYHFINNAIFNRNIVVNTSGLKSWSTMYIGTVMDIILKLVYKYSWDRQFKELNISYGIDIDIIDVAKCIKSIIESDAEIIVNKPIDYEKFYMDNKELNSTIGSNYSFEQDLCEYISFVKNEGNL